VLIGVQSDSIIDHPRMPQQQFSDRIKSRAIASPVDQLRVKLSFQ